MRATATQPLRAIQFDWASPDGASEVQVRIEASDDLDRWRRARAGEHAAARDARRPGTATRAHRAAAAAHTTICACSVRTAVRRCAINRVIAERVGAAAEIEPVWFTATMLAVDDTRSVCSSMPARRAPVQLTRACACRRRTARCASTLHSRDDEQGAVERALERRGYLIVTETRAARKSAGAFRRDHAIATGACRSRRIRSCIARRCWSWAIDPRGCASWRRDRARSRSRSAAGAPSCRAPARCDALLADVSRDERAQMVGEGLRRARRVLGGDDGAASRCRRQTPLRLVVLWGVLIVGVALLVAMALSLLKRVRTTGLRLSRPRSGCSSG